jgi:hypothetical protein
VTTPVRAALANVRTHNGTSVTPKNLRWAATHEALCRSYIFDVLNGLADALEAETTTGPCWRGECRTGCYYPDVCSEMPACQHEWLDRPESDTRECLICGDEVAG